MNVHEKSANGAIALENEAPEGMKPAGVILQTEEALHLGVLLHKDGHFDEAERLYRKILDSSPDNLNALHFLGLICHQQDRHAEASELIGRIVDLRPQDPEAHNNFGNTLAALGEFDRAEACYRKAIGLNAYFASAYSNLGVMLMRRGELAEALEACRKAAELAPDRVDSNFSLGQALRRSGRVDEAVGVFRNVLRLNPDHLMAWQELARIFGHEGRHKEAVEIFNEFAHATRDNECVKYFEAAFLDRETPDRAPDSYVEMIFDHMATHFDSHLKDHLDYRAPELLVDALEDFLPPPSRVLEILDAGCGTGLCGALLRPHAKNLTGVDLSSGMLAKASERNIYDNLVKSELREFLGQSSEEYDVIVSADTLCYFGPLETVVVNAFKALKTGGLFAFTLELAQEEGRDFRLNPNSRYSHTGAYARGSLRAAGFAVKVSREVVLRTEGGEPVTGQLLVAGKE